MIIFADGAHARTLARLICPASSTTRTSSAGTGFASSARHQVHATAPTTSIVRERRALSMSALSSSTVAAAWVGGWPPLGFCPMRTGTPAAAAATATSSSTFPMTLWLFATTPTRLPAATSATMTRAPVYVLPDPGGPWIGRMPPGAVSAMRVAASSAVSPAFRSGTPGPCPASGGRRRSSARTAAMPAADASSRSTSPSPLAATHWPVRSRLSASSLLGTMPSGTIERGSGSPALASPRVIVIVLAASSTSTTDPADAPVLGSLIVLSSPIRWSCGGNENRYWIDFLTGRDSSSWRPPMGSRSSISSSSVLPISSKNRHQADLSSRRCHAEQLGEQPSAGGLRIEGPLHGIVGIVRGERRREGGDLLLPLGELLRRGAVVERRASERSLAGLEVPPPVLEPVAESPVAHDVVAVVALDPGQDRLRVGDGRLRPHLEPGLEGDDAAAGVLELDLAVERVQRLDPLDRVALDAREDALADGAEQVHEHAAAQQPVDLLLARPVALGEAAERGPLVGRVVVDVHRRVGRPAVHDQVDRALERGLLGRPRHEPVVVDAPDRVELRHGSPSGAANRPSSGSRGSRIPNR